MSKTLNNSYKTRLHRLFLVGNSIFAQTTQLDNHNHPLGSDGLWETLDLRQILPLRERLITAL